MDAKDIITNVPLILKVCVVIFVCFQTDNLPFRRVFQGGQDLFDNLGVKKVLALSIWPIICLAAWKNITNF
jgi:hypothetical protein